MGPLWRLYLSNCLQKRSFSPIITSVLPQRKLQKVPIAEHELVNIYEPKGSEVHSIAGQKKRPQLVGLFGFWLPAALRQY
jgi:hypothetical protein